MRTGENDKLDAKHNAGVGPGIRQLGQRGESRGNFSLFLPLLVSRHFLLSPIFFPPFLSFFHFRTNIALLFTRFLCNKRERSFRRMRIFVWNNRLHRFETTSRSLIEDVDRALIEDVVGLLCKDFDLAKRARGDALRALVTSRAESSRGPWNRFPTIEIGPPLSRCSTERKPHRALFLGNEPRPFRRGGLVHAFRPRDHLFCSHFAQPRNALNNRLINYTRWGTVSRHFFYRNMDFRVSSERVS